MNAALWYNRRAVLDLNTFSIVARDVATGDYGVAVATARPNVGALVPWVSLQGAVATQARANTELGRQGLALLEQGVAVDVALLGLLQADGDRDLRQVHGVDGTRGFCHTGSACVPWCGHRISADMTVAGNMLTGPEVVDAMADAFRSADAQKRELSERLLIALEAGQAAGGDKRGKQSAALLVASRSPRRYHNLRVDDHVDPVGELRRLYGLVVEHMQQVEREYGADSLTLFGRVKS